MSLFVGLTHSGARPRLTQTVAAAWLVAALLSAGLGLVQYFGVSAAFEPWVNVTQTGQAYANLRQRNQFATLIQIGLVALLWWRVQGPVLPVWSRSAISRWAPLRTGLILVAAVLLGAANAASSSRTGLVQLALVVALALGWGARHKAQVWQTLLAAVLGYAIAAVALPVLAGMNVGATGILARVQEQAPACASRLTLWRNVLYLIAQKPVLGWGWGELDYAHFMTLYPGTRFCEILDNAHNLPLHLAVELGIPMALWVCGAGMWGVWRAKPWLEADATRQLAWSVLAVIVVHSLLEYPLWYGPFQMAAGLSIWLLWRKHGARAEASSTMAVVSAMVATVLVAGIAYAALAYQRVSQIYLEPPRRLAAYRDHTLDKLQKTWLFKDQVRFAELTTTPLTRNNAADMAHLSKSLLHFSPEARVAEIVIESEMLLGHPDEALYYLARYRAAFPGNHAAWAQANQAR